MTIYIIGVIITFLGFVSRLLYLWKYSAQDLQLTDILFSIIVSISWLLTWLLLLWVYIDENMNGTLLKGKK